MIQAVIISSEEASGVCEKNCSSLSISFFEMRNEAQASERLESKLVLVASTEWIC